jgi:hypothetical protein
MNEGKKDRRDPIRTIKARNPVAKNASSAIGGGAAGAHKDKKRAAKQGDVKHKNQEYAESLQNKLDAILAEDAKFGVYYNEKLAQKVFDQNPNLNTSGRAEEVMNAGYKIAVVDLGKKQAQGLFGYDEDFPSDFVSAYSWLQKNGNVSETQQYSKFTVGQRATFKNSQGQEFPVIVTAVDYDDDAVRFKHANNKPFPDGELEQEVDPGWRFLTPDRQYNPNSLVKATSRESRVGEDFDSPEYNDEAGMAENNLLTLARAVKGLYDTIGDDDNLPEWCQEKIAKAEMMLVSVWDYLLSQKAQGIDPSVKETGYRNYDDNRSGFRRREREDDEYHVPDPEVAKESWTHDTLAARLFETENTYEDKLTNMLNKKLRK